MLNITEIEKFYPENQQVFKRNILREYLQYKILQIIFNTEYASKLSFMGGTCLRIIFGTNRYSEDLDFDNFGLTETEFDFLAETVAKELGEEGYVVEIKTIHKGAFRCYIRIPGLLFDNKLSGYQEEKILIQLDTESQQYDYRTESFIINKFDILFRINYTPKNILLSQKIWAILNRKTPKGRDFYDAMYLFSIATPDYNYLSFKAGVNNIQELKTRLELKIQSINLKELIRDVTPFLINIDDIKRVELFPEFLKGLNNPRNS
jgi:predicted nucleotidyltransferase component of viral defense system